MGSKSSSSEIIIIAKKLWGHKTGQYIPKLPGISSWTESCFNPLLKTNWELGSKILERWCIGCKINRNPGKALEAIELWIYPVVDNSASL